MTMYRRELLSLGVLALVPQIRARAQAPPADLISDLVAGNHILASENILDGYGHISVRRPQNKDRFLLSRSIAPESVTAADILEYGLDGEPIDPKGKTSYKERFIHSEIYRARPDVNAVVHCHTPSLIPFGVTKKPLRPMYHQSAFLAAGVPVFEIRDAGGMTNMLVETAALGHVRDLAAAVIEAVGLHDDVDRGRDLRKAAFAGKNARLVVQTSAQLIQFRLIDQTNCAGT